MALVFLLVAPERGSSALVFPTSLSKILFFREKFSENNLARKKNLIENPQVIFFSNPPVMLLQGHGAQFFKKINFFFYHLKNSDPREGVDFRCLNFYSMSRKCPTRVQ